MDDATVFFTSSQTNEDVVLLDTQTSIHLISNKDLLADIQRSAQPITVQRITGDRVTVALEGNIHQLESSLITTQMSPPTYSATTSCNKPTQSLTENKTIHSSLFLISSDQNSISHV